MDDKERGLQKEEGKEQDRKALQDANNVLRTDVY